MRFLLILLGLFAAPVSARDLLLVGNKGEDTLSFVDLRSGQEFARLPTGRMPHEIAVAPHGRHAAVVAYGGRSIDIVELAGRRVLRTIDLTPNDGPHGLVWLKDGRLVATTERSRSVVVIDPIAGDVRSVGTGQPGTHMIAVSRDGRRGYTSNIPAGTVTVLDLKALRKERDLTVGGSPEGIALSPDGRTLWVADLAGARVQAFDTSRLDRGPKAVATTGRRPIRVLTSPDGRWAVTSNFADGTLTVIDANTFKVARTITVSGDEKAGQVTILFSNDGQRLYVAETGRNKVAEIDFRKGQVLRRLPAGQNGDGLALARAPD